MEVKKRNKDRSYIKWNLNDKKSIVNFINESMNPKNKWITIGDDLNSFVNEILNSNESLTFTKWRSLYWSKHIKDYSKPTTYDFWIVRGYSKDYAKSMITKKAKSAGQSFSRKIKQNPEKYKDYTATQIGYWIKKGYSKSEAKQKLKERQTTFTLEKCIRKYGKIKGTQVFNNRQTKWLNSINKSKNVTWNDFDKDCRSLNHFKDIKQLAKKYLSYNFISDDVANLYSSITKFNIQNNKDLLKWINGLSYNEVFLVSKLKPIQSLSKMNRYEIIEYYLNVNGHDYKLSKWGRLYWFNGKYFQSTGEFSIGVWLSLNNIQFTMHKRYPIDDILFYDFFLPEYNVYIEYCGRSKESYKRKRKLTSTLPIIWGTDIDSIIKKIKKLIKN